MYSEKLENLLVFSLDATAAERNSFADLSSGVDTANDRWELIAKFYSESENEFVEKLKSKYAGIEVTPLLCGYCIIVTSKNHINQLADEPEIVYIEKSKALNPNLTNAKRASCIPVDGVKSEIKSAFNFSSEQTQSLSGAGVITAIIDTGINIDDDAFKNKDNTTRILRLVDQQSGKIYDSNDINDELSSKNNPEIFGYNQNLFYDYSNHGINVCKIACGNDGVAYNSSIIFVILRRSENGYYNTTDLIKAVDYCVRTAAAMNMPVSINISYGSSYGAHLDDDIQTAYINDVSSVWKSLICVAAGNEGTDAVHAHTSVKDLGTAIIELAVGEYEQNISFAAWQSSLDDIDFRLTAPDGTVYSADSYDSSGVMITSAPSKPYSMTKEIYAGLSASGSKDYVASGIWKLIFMGKSVKDGNIDIWLSTATTLSSKTGFLRPSPELTFTIPSTAKRVMTVGAYNAAAMTPSYFSGRGYVNPVSGTVKPDIVAPGENITINGKTIVTGTSFAAPFVTGAAALLMEWGIVRGNDTYMYGDKLKSALQKGAVPLQGQPAPSPVCGWGRLCVDNTFRRLRNDTLNIFSLAD